MLAPSSHGKTRVQLELQELWLLGYSEFILTTPGSRIGIIGAARTNKGAIWLICLRGPFLQAILYLINLP